MLGSRRSGARQATAGRTVERIPVVAPIPRPCAWCRRSGTLQPNRISHSGLVNGALVVVGCEWHVHAWRRDPASLTGGSRG